MSIQNQTSVPFLQDNVLKASGGAESDFIIKRNLITRLPSPYGNCLGDTNPSKYHNHIVNILNASYSGELCLQVCLQDQIINNCGCLNRNLPLYGNISNLFCSDALTQGICINSTINNNKGSSTCQIECPPECISSEYDFITTRATYPTHYYYINYLLNFILKKGINFSVNFSPEAFTKINIYYEKMEYTEITEEKKFVMADLMSNLGKY